MMSAPQLPQELMKSAPQLLLTIFHRTTTGCRKLSFFLRDSTNDSLEIKRVAPHSHRNLWMIWAGLPIAVASLLVDDASVVDDLA